MNWLRHLNDALSYIEENLTGDIDPCRIAQLAGCSQFQFLRMFPYLTGISLQDYIRRRRMTRAAADLVTEDTRVVDIALRYGYASPTAFARAFRAVHGASPSDVRNGSAVISVCPRLTFSLTVKGTEQVNYRIEELPAFRAVGVADPDMCWDETNASVKAAAFWEKLGAGVHQILDLMDGHEPTGLLGISLSIGEKRQGEYIAAVATDAPCPAGMVERNIPAATYAVFECSGAMPDAMGRLWHNILSQWLPSSGYTWDTTGDIERYLTPVMTSPDAKSEVWIPVRKLAQAR